MNYAAALSLMYEFKRTDMNGTAASVPILGNAKPFFKVFSTFYLQFINQICARGHTSLQQRCKKWLGNLSSPESRGGRKETWICVWLANKQYQHNSIICIYRNKNNIDNTFSPFAKLSFLKNGCHPWCLLYQNYIVLWYIKNIF